MNDVNDDNALTDMYCIYSLCEIFQTVGFAQDLSSHNAAHISDAGALEWVTLMAFVATKRVSTS